MLVVVLALGLGSPCEGSQGVDNLNIPQRVGAIDPTLQRAIDAYRQVTAQDSVHFERAASSPF